jgi:hypothetical protein
MTAFDPIHAQREMLAGLADVHRVITARSRDSERRLTEAEAEHNALAKIERFVAGLIQDHRAVLVALEVEAEARAKTGSPP